MGLENLKKQSKLALHPIKMIHKYQITLKGYDVTYNRLNDKKDIIQL